jgi:hypothetical protein
LWPQCSSWLVDVPCSIGAPPACRFRLKLILWVRVASGKVVY